MKKKIPSKVYIIPFLLAILVGAFYFNQYSFEDNKTPIFINKDKSLISSNFIGKNQHTLPFSLYAPDISPNGKFFVGNKDGSSYLYNISGEGVKFNDYAYGSWSADSKLYLRNSEPNRSAVSTNYSIWDTDNLKMIRTFKLYGHHFLNGILNDGRILITRFTPHPGMDPIKSGEINNSAVIFDPKTGVETILYESAFKTHLYFAKMSPDQSKICFIDGKNLYLYSFSQKKLETSPLSLKEEDFFGFDCNWSPDSRYLALEYSTRTRNYAGIGILNIDSKQINLIPLPNYDSGLYFQAWSANGKDLYFASDKITGSYIDTKGSKIPYMAGRYWLLNINTKKIKELPELYNRMVMIPKY